MRSLSLTFVLFASLVLAPAAALADLDIMPHVADGQIVTGGVTHATSVNPVTGVDYSPDTYLFTVDRWRVYGYAFGENSFAPLYPTWTQDPGVNHEPGTYRDAYTLADYTTTGTGLPLGSSLSLQILGDLQYWTGTDFEAVPNGETVLLQNGPAGATVGTGTGVQDLLLKTFSADDSIHIHLSSTLEGGDPTDGAYLISARLVSSSSSIQPSETFWLVYSFNDEAGQAAAMEWVNANLAPEPATLALLAVGGAWLARRRRAR